MKGDKQEQRQSSGSVVAEQRQSSGSKRRSTPSKANMKGDKQEQRQSSANKRRSTTLPLRSKNPYRLPSKANMKGDKQEQRQSSGKQNADPQPYHREVRTLIACQLSGEKTMRNLNGTMMKNIKFGRTISIWLHKPIFKTCPYTHYMARHLRLACDSSFF